MIIACDEGSYCMNGTSYLCDIGSSSIAGSDSINDCYCLPGYYGTHETCTCMTLNTAPSHLIPSAPTLNDGFIAP